MNRQQRRHPEKQQMPPAIAFLEAAELMGSGSPLYRVHRPAQVLAHQLEWITLVTSRAAEPQEPGDPWMVEVDGIPMCPPVLILRPTVLAATRANDDYSDLTQADVWTQQRRNVELAQKAGQIVFLDLDDHPYAWNELHSVKERFDDETWEAHDAYVASFNAVLCSTKYLQEQVMAPRFGDRQRFFYAPNLYDPFRYDPSQARFGKTLGSHLYVKARDSADFDVLGDALRPLFDSDPELRFLHIGEEYNGACCGHRRDEHFMEDGPGPCDNCRCERYGEGSNDSLARAANLPADRIDVLPTVSPHDLHKSLSYNVGVVPLADSVWNYAKTEGKGFEMAAAGIPFVALTGQHPLYKGTGVDFSDFPGGWEQLTGDPYQWQVESRKVRKWAERIAQEHQIEYLATMKKLAQMNLAK